MKIYQSQQKYITKISFSKTRNLEGFIGNQIQTRIFSFFFF